LLSKTIKVEIEMTMKLSYVSRWFSAFYNEQILIEI